MRIGNRLVDSRYARVAVPPGSAFTPIEQIGRKSGWYYADWLWNLRGWVDRMIGGVGMRRDPNTHAILRPGETLDFWRVEAFDPGKRLRLLAEMKLPGRAWLEFTVHEHGNGSVIRQTATFDPVGLGGLLYWYSVFPLHQLIFNGMLREIARRSEQPGNTSLRK